MARFFVADWGGKRFMHEALEETTPVFAVLRDAGASRIWSGTVHPDQASADREAQRAPGIFEGPVVATVELREVSPEEAEDLGAEVSSDPELFREIHRRTIQQRQQAADEAATPSGPRR